MKIIIKTEFSNDYTTRIAGEQLRHLLTKCSGESEVDFSEVKIASASFFDEAFAKLILEDPDKPWFDFISVTNIHKMDDILLTKVCIARGLKRS